MIKTTITTLASATLAASLFVSAGVAQANTLGIKNSSAITFAGYNGQPANFTGVYTNGQQGTLFANVPGTIRFTYLGNESGYSNSFSFLGNFLNENNAVGDKTNEVSVESGDLNFSFNDSEGASFSNGDSATPVLGFAILNGNLTPVNGPDYGPFDYVLGFNDSSSGDADYDDFVVGVNFSPLSAVPLPASLPLMATALGLFTLVRRRF